MVTDSGARYVFAPGSPLPDGDPLADRGRRAPADPAAIFYTSGTTGFPKGAVTTHENFLSNAETCRRALSVAAAREPSRTLISVPLFHVTGCNSQLLCGRVRGRHGVIMPPFEVGAFLRAIEQERIDVLVTVPAIYWLAINQPHFAETDISRVRSVCLRRRADRPGPGGADDQGVPAARGWATGSASPRPSAPCPPSCRTSTPPRTPIRSASRPR